MDKCEIRRFEVPWQQTCMEILAQPTVGIDDMTLLEEVNDHTIAENLKMRLMVEQIYTCIGRVLIAVNPFKKLVIYDKKYVSAYHHFLEAKQSHKRTNMIESGDVIRSSTALLANDLFGEEYEYEFPDDEERLSTRVDLPPHIYALTDNMYRNMMIEKESQCVIISGESGAGKTISAKYIMSYLSEIASGGTQKIEEIKNIIIQSNPLLEAFGNAKTLRNNNSSRFGKFVEIIFNMSGQPDGGKISNFLLEKSRVVSLNPGERSYHVFYQLLRGCSEEQLETFGLEVSDPAEYYYLNRTGVYDVPDVNDNKDFQATLNAMNVVGLSEEVQSDVLGIVSAILHLGNIQFIEEGNAAVVENPAGLAVPAQLLGVESDSLKEKLISRLMEARWGGEVDIMMMTLDVEQANVTRDALAKALYAQLFNFLVARINSAMHKDNIELCIGVLDIYGFEIFETNGFEQFCINFVNEKLQQIFVELTLKSEQEEYKTEGIEWTPVKFFDNKMVCNLIESKNPPGIMSILDDVCFTVHASEGSDRTLMEKLKALVGSERSYARYFHGLSTHFEINHYAGKVHYEAAHFVERNKDSLFDDIVQLMQSSTNEFIQSLFADMPTTSGRRGRSSTGSSTIKSQCQILIDRIMACTPHYVRCLKPSETKDPLDWHDQRILPQISYLGLRENINVRRAGFAFRKSFEKVIEKYGVILEKDELASLSGKKASICQAIMTTAQFPPDIWKIGKSKVFMKHSDMITKLEHLRNEALYSFVVVLQSLVRGFLARTYYKKLLEKKRREEEERKRIEEEKRRAEEEKRRKEEEERKRVEEEARKRAEEEKRLAEQKKQAEKEKQLAEEDGQRLAEEENRGGEQGTTLKTPEDQMQRDQQQPQQTVGNVNNVQQFDAQTYDDPSDYMVYQQQYDEPLNQNIVQKKPSMFSLNLEFGKCGGKVSCKGVDVSVAASEELESQFVDLEIFFKLPWPFNMRPGEILISPFIVVDGLVEDQTYLKLTVPYLKDLPEQPSSMTKRVRFYGMATEYEPPSFQDYCSPEDLDAFKVEFKKDKAKLHIQQNVTFCIVGLYSGQLQAQCNNPPVTYAVPNKSRLNTQQQESADYSSQNYYDGNAQIRNQGSYYPQGTPNENFAVYGGGESYGENIQTGQIYGGNNQNQINQLNAQTYGSTYSTNNFLTYDTYDTTSEQNYATYQVGNAFDDENEEMYATYDDVYAQYVPHGSSMLPPPRPFGMIDSVISHQYSTPVLRNPGFPSPPPPPPFMGDSAVPSPPPSPGDLVVPGPPPPPGPGGPGPPPPPPPPPLLSSSLVGDSAPSGPSSVPAPEPPATPRPPRPEGHSPADNLERRGSKPFAKSWTRVKVKKRR